MLFKKYDGGRLSPRSMWDYSITISLVRGAGIAALGSTRHLEISLAATSPSCSIKEYVSSLRLQGLQLPPEDLGIAESVPCEDSVVRLLVSWDAAASFL
jgi:hypothetical protein